MSMKLLCHGMLWMGVVGLGSIGCEKHTFDETKVLHMGHGDHGDAHGEGHGEARGHDEAHAKDGHQDDHAKGDAHHGDEAKPKAEAKVENKTDEPREVGL